MLSRFSIGRLSRSGRVLTQAPLIRTHLSVDHAEQVLHRPAIQVRQDENTFFLLANGEQQCLQHFTDPKPKINNDKK
jgi:hypothetical protein